MQNIGKKMEGKYRFLLDFPSAKVSLIVVICMIPVLSILYTYISGELSIFSYTKYISLSVYFELIGILVLNIFQRLMNIKNILRLHRALFVSFTNLITLTVFMLISIELGFVSIYFRYSMESLGLGFIMWTFFLNLYMFTTDKLRHTLWKSIIPGITIILIDHFVYPFARIFIGNLLVLSLSSIAIYLVLVGVTKLTLNIARTFTDFDALSGLRGFFFGWFENTYEVIEDAFYRSSISKYVPIGILKIKQKKGKELAIITPYIHPGPFLEVGSSNMPYMLYKKFGQRNVFAMTLHGTCSHGENLPRNKDVDALFNMLYEDYTKIKSLSGISDIVRVKHKGFTFTAQRFGKYVLLIVTRSPNDLDDISISIGEQIFQKLKVIGLEGLLVDAHNSLSEPHAISQIMDGTELSMDILEGANIAIDKVMRMSDVEVYGAWVHEEVTELDIKDGLGFMGISVFLEKINGKKFAYILIDANNLGSGVRDAILKRLIEEGIIDDGEILTTDTHSVNAHMPKSAYPLLRMDKAGILFKHIKYAIKKAERNMDKLEANGIVSEYKLKIVGEDKISKLVSASDALSKVFPTLLVFTMLVSFSIPALFLMLFG